MHHSGRRCIPAGCVARRLHTPGMRAPRALPAGRLNAQNGTLISNRVLTDVPAARAPQPSRRISPAVAADGRAAVGAADDTWRPGLEHGPADRHPRSHRLLVHLSLRLVRGARHAARTHRRGPRHRERAGGGGAVFGNVAGLYTRVYDAGGVAVGRSDGSDPHSRSIDALWHRRAPLSVVAGCELRPRRLRGVAGRAAARTAGPGARERSGAALAPCADRSALSLQQPELDQRADDGGSSGARRMCLLLGDFLRETLALGSEDRITLSRELALLDRFLAIERVRFGDRLRAELCAGDAGGCCVPPLLLQPIVENAVTHGIAHLIEGVPSGSAPTAAGPGCASSSRTRAIPTGRNAAAPASVWRTCAPGCARCTGRTGRSSLAKRTRSGAWS